MDQFRHWTYESKKSGASKTTELPEWETPHQTGGADTMKWRRLGKCQCGNFRESLGGRPGAVETCTLSTEAELGS
jgi:hypothetical protein